MTVEYSIAETSRKCGVSPNLLRIWEARHGWPLPNRCTNGYRRFTHEQVLELKHVARLLKGGLAISSIIINGRPHFPPQKRAMRAKTKLPFLSSVPRPADHRMRADQGLLFDALRADRHEAIGILQMADRHYRPVDLVAFFLRPALQAVRKWNGSGHGHPLAGAVGLLIWTRLSELRHRYGFGLGDAMAGDSELIEFVIVNGGVL